MNHSERFRALMKGEKLDRAPVYFFGIWAETRDRWLKEGLVTENNRFIQLPDMDPDWEEGMWNCHGLVIPYAIGDFEPQVLEETNEYIISRTQLGEIVKNSKIGSTMTYHIKYALEPTRESWENFKRYIDPDNLRHRTKDWEKKARNLITHDKMLTFMGGSLYGYLRGWMGVENLSLLMYDDPELFEEMVSYMADYFMKLYEPILKIVNFDLVYFFEDCCGSNGPLFSPAIYLDVFDKHYRRMTKFYKDNKVAFTLLDSDGVVDKFIPLWLDSGIDIIFPIEVGVWNESPLKLRKKFGTRLKMMGGINKHVISKGEDAIRQHLLELVPVFKEGGYLPIPDHRISPEVSYQDMLTYIQVYNEVFN